MAPASRILASGGAVAAAAALAVPLMAHPSAATGPPLEGSGTGMITDVQVTSARTAGPNSIQERSVTFVLTDGPLAGELVQHVRGVVHDGQFVTFHGTATFTGTVEGCGAGTLTLGIAGKGSAGDFPVTDASVRVIQHSANTIDVRGVGTASQNGPFMEYEIQYVC